jgi:hypothetical protein
MVQIHSPRPLSLFLSSTYALALQTCSTEFVAHVAQLRPNSGPETCGTLKPFDVLGSTVKWFARVRDWQRHTRSKLPVIAAVSPKDSGLVLRHSAMAERPLFPPFPDCHAKRTCNCTSRPA